LSGNYGSVFKGRSLDFDDLREYNYGDDIKDIDWKATARSRSVMIRRYVAVRKHNILLVADNGNTMATLAPSGESKQEVATFCAGVMAYIAHHHSDFVGMVFGNKGSNSRYMLKEDTSYIENFLDKYSKSMKLTAPESDLNSLLNYVSKTYRERSFMLIISDADSISRIDIELVRKLQLWQGRVEAFREERQYQIAIADIYYIEAVDERTFLYLEKDCYESRKKLYEFEEVLASRRFARISKAVILDLMKVESIRPALNGRFLCRLTNGEEVIISRKYVAEIKEKLKG
jgi:DNA-binding LytR/AlgR family response regulator